MDHRGSFGERVVMTCQVCMNGHHEGQKEVYVEDPRTGAYARKICPLCMCLDCVQTHDDPIRRQIRPLMKGQTLAQQPDRLRAVAVIGIALEEILLRNAVERGDDDVRPERQPGRRY